MSESKSDGNIPSLSQLQGWLVKKKNDSNKKKFPFMSADKTRYFRVREVKGIEEVELTLCYFSSPKDEEPRGSIFLKDVSAIEDDTKSITLTTSARMLTIQTESKVQHRTWLNGLVHYCPRAAINRLQTQDLLAIKTRNDQAKGTSSSSSSYLPDAKECSDDVSYDGSANTAGSERSSGSNGRRKGEKERGKRPDHRKEKYVSSNLGATSRLHASIRNGDLGIAESPLPNDRRPHDEGVDDIADPRNLREPPGSQEKNIDAYIGTLPSPNRGKVSSMKSKAKTPLKANDDGEHIDTMDLNAMNTRKPRKFRNPRGTYADDDFDDERENSSLDDSDIMFNNGGIAHPKAEEKAPVDTSSTSSSMTTPNRNEKSIGGGRKAIDGVFSPEDAKGEAKGTRKMSADEIVKQKSSGLLDISMEDEIENQLDLQEEKTRYEEACESKALSDLSQGSSRPPPGPRTTPYNTDCTTQWSNNNNAMSRSGNERPLTPPRKAGNPGTTVDSNFVDDDWDNENDSNSRQESHVRKVANRGDTEREMPRRHKVEDPPRIINGEVFVGGDTRPDDDFLDADWD